MKKELFAASLVVLATLPSLALRANAPSSVDAPTTESRWFRGNLHTHSLWSDGNNYPEMIADWYKAQGYNFLAFTEHNVLQQGNRWIEIKPQLNFYQKRTYELGGGKILQGYVGRFGKDWVEQREVEGRNEVRLKPLGEYRALLEEPGKFLLLQGEEVTSSWQKTGAGTESENHASVHINVTNLQEAIPTATGDTAIAIWQKTSRAVREQQERVGRQMIAQLNHPNFNWGVSAEELAQAGDCHFFEIYNGHQLSNNEGDAHHLSVDAMWDVALAWRLGKLGFGPIYALAVDDSHNWREWGLGKSNAGRGWIVVRAQQLTPESLLRAMEAGDFYASTGVRLKDVRRDATSVSVVIDPMPGVSYVTRFIGTRRGFDSSSEPFTADSAHPAAGVVHRRYSKDVGAVLAEVEGANASYRLKGDEIYVRAKIISSKPKENGAAEKEFETAWTQPWINVAPR